MKLTHQVLIRTAAGQAVTIGVGWNEIDGHWVDLCGNKYDPGTGKRVGDDFSIIDLGTLQAYTDFENNVSLKG